MRGVDWDLPKSGADWYRVCRAFTFAFWHRYDSIPVEIADWARFCKGWERYPLCSSEDAFLMQTNYLLIYIQPSMERLRDLADKFTVFQWKLATEGHGRFNSPQLTLIEQVRLELKDAWPKKPKGRK